jgi:GNAT superfamily N-acetyltransferase
MSDTGLQHSLPAGLRLAISHEPSPADVQYLEDRLYEFNTEATGIAGGAWLAIVVRDDDGRIVAGLGGAIWGGCLEIRQLWVEDSRRRQGLGATLLAAAEQEARRHGCTQVLLMTFSFQAPRFYARHGFALVATIEDHPHEHQNLLLRKRLDRSP